VSPTGRVFRPAALAKVVVFLAALVPVAMLVRGFLTGNLGVNPAETIQLETGRWTLKFLLLSLAVTPVRRLTGWNIVIQFRRMIGLFAFFYALLHFASYWAFDLSFAFDTMVTDVIKRPFIAFGFAALMLPFPPARAFRPARAATGCARMSRSAAYGRKRTAARTARPGACV